LNEPNRFIRVIIVTTICGTIFTETIYFGTRILDLHHRFHAHVEMTIPNSFWAVG
jgi:hypothetical protein